jgi:hypothetical protein
VIKITEHPHWKLVYRLEAVALAAPTFAPLLNDAAALIRELKQEIRQLEDRSSRLEFPDTTGQ